MQAHRHKTVHRLSLHPGQCEVFNDKSRFKVVVAGRRWGKSNLAKTMIINEARVPKRKIWYIAPTYRMAKQIMWDDLLSSIPKAWVYKINETMMVIRLINGTIIECKGADKPDTLRGVGLHMVVLDEFQDMKEEVWKKVIRPTLAKDRGRAIIIGTPKGYQNLYEVYILGQDPNNKTWKSWQFPTITSPFIPITEIEAARSDMTAKDFRQEFEASFETMSGRVYYEFDRKIHTGKYAFNPLLPIWVGQDFNVDPMSTIIMQPQPSGEIWVVDEIILPNSNTAEVCDEIERKYWRYKSVIIVYPDPAGANRQSGRGESDLDIFREKGFPRIKYRRKHPRQRDRFNAVNRMFMDATGRIRLRVNETCKHLINSLEQTLYKQGTAEIDKSLNVEHATDGLGYPIELEFPIRKVEIMGRSL